MKAVACAANSLNVVARSPEGTVHSLFSSSLNFQFGERLVHMSSGNYGRLPFGLIVDSGDLIGLLDWIARGDPVYWDEKNRTLSFFETGHYFSLDGITVYSNNLALPEWRLRPECYETLLHSVASQDSSCGLGLSVKTALAEAGAVIGRTDGSSGLDGLQEAFFSHDITFIEHRLRFLIGRGGLDAQWR